MYKKTTMSSKMTSKLQQYQEDFYDEVFDFFGKDIIGSDTHPLKAAFNLYVEMKKDQETDDEEEEASKLCWTCDEAEATHKVFRDALGEYEHTCDKCFKKEYLEEEEEEDKVEEGKCEDCGNECEDLDDKLCHKCYHASVPSGECWCGEDKVEEGKCEDCGNECEDLDDKLCHKCYHASVPSGECWCGEDKVEEEEEEELISFESLTKEEQSKERIEILKKSGLTDGEIEKFKRLM